MNAITRTPLESLDAWLGENYPTLKASLRKTDVGYLIAAAMLKLAKFQRQQTAKEIADWLDRLIESYGNAPEAAVLRAVVIPLREKYEVQP